MAIKENIMKLLCVGLIEGFTINKKYKILGCAGEYIELRDDLGNKCIILETNFKCI